MSYKKLSTKDWKSSALRLVNVYSKPKSKEKVTAQCSKCGIIRSIIFIELVRATNRHLKYTDAYVCPECLRNLDEYKKNCKNKSEAVRDKIIKGSSERSKALWADESYREKCTTNIRQYTQTKEFRQKISHSIKRKFEDPEYVAKIKKARSNYWNNDEYKYDKTWSLDEFLDAAKEEHGDKYDYSLIDYNNIRTKVIIICKKHGEFTQRPSHHIFYGNGCPACAWEIKESKPQKEIADFVSSCGFDVNINNRSEIGMELDIFISDMKLAIEYHGGYWHSYDKPESYNQKRKHSRKANLAYKHGISLIQILDVEWINRQHIVKSIILHKLNMSKRIFARNCKLIELDSKTATTFFNNNHIAKSRGAHLYYGLTYKDNIVSAISLYNRGNNIYELMRFCHLTNHTIVGGLSKLLKHAIANNSIKKITTYADRRFSVNAEGYKKVGFDLLYITKPGYYYWRNNKLYNRRKFQKNKLSKLLADFDPSKTEAENMFANGYRRIWDAGHFKLSLTC